MKNTIFISGLYIIVIGAFVLALLVRSETTNNSDRIQGIIAGSAQLQNRIGDIEYYIFTRECEKIGGELYHDKILMPSVPPMCSVGGKKLEWDGHDYTEIKIVGNRIIGLPNTANIRCTIEGTMPIDADFICTFPDGAVVYARMIP